jgi:quinol monooxygenase YgiN
MVALARPCLTVGDSGPDIEWHRRRAPASVVGGHTARAVVGTLASVKGISAMPVRLIVTFDLKPGTADAFIQSRLARHAEVQREPGCQQYELFKSAERPNAVVLLERWATPADLATHHALNQTRPQLGTEFRVGPSTSESYEVA